MLLLNNATTIAIDKSTLPVPVVLQATTSQPGSRSDITHSPIYDNTIWPCNARPARLYTGEHVLTQCPIHSSPRRRHFGNRPSIAFILGTEADGRGFANFIDETGVFLRPLPPPPDPDPP